jgi:hypothetical protein
VSYLQRGDDRSGAEDHEQRGPDELGKQAAAKIGVHDSSAGLA